MFRFRQFIVEDALCAMKVGTDGVLLGAWTEVHKDNRVLDIGSGSGLISLMLAQKGAASVDAIDIDPMAVQQSQLNFDASPWSCCHAHLSSLQDWRGTYSLIVSNPPYFVDSLKNPDAARQAARHTDTLSYEELITHAYRLLSDGGRLCLILPAQAETDILALACAYPLQLRRICRVKGVERKPYKRMMVEWVKCVGATECPPALPTALTLMDSTGGRSAEYSELCKDFYLT